MFKLKVVEFNNVLVEFMKKREGLADNASNGGAKPIDSIDNMKLRQDSKALVEILHRITGLSKATLDPLIKGSSRPVVQNSTARVLATALYCKIEDIFDSAEEPVILPTPFQKLMDDFRSLARLNPQISNKQWEGGLLKLRKATSGLGIGGPEVFRVGEEVEILVHMPFAGRVTLLSLSQTSEGEACPDVQLLDHQIEGFSGASLQANIVNLGSIPIRDPVGRASVIALMVPSRLTGMVDWIKVNTDEGKPTVYNEATRMLNSLNAMAGNVAVSILDIRVMPADEAVKFNHRSPRRFGSSRPHQSPDKPMPGKAEAAE
jgi:hypothetical protein